MSDKLNERFSFPREALEERLGFSLNHALQGYDTIVSFRDLRSIDHVAFFCWEVLKALVRRIPLRTGEAEVYPYADAEIEVYGVEPGGVAVGQTFMHQKKLLGIMQDLTGAFSSFVTKGISKMPPVQVYGRTVSGEKALAFYLPPLVEHHGAKGVLLDGIHRSYLCKSAGTTINAIHLQHITAPLLFDPISWEKVAVREEKPPIAERYVNLQPHYFRDLTAVGIDG